MSNTAPNVPASRLLGLNVVIVLLISLEALDSLMVGTSMPTILANLGGIGWYGWTVGAFGLASFASIPIFGNLTGRWGLRRTILLALAFFLLGSATAALAPKMKLLVGARVLQGIGMGGITALPFTIISGSFPRELRSKPLGLISPVWVVCGFLGPVIASQILKYAEWPWVFWFNIPVLLLAAALVIWIIPEQPNSEKVAQKMNFLGPILFSIAAGFALKAFTSEWPINLAQWSVAAIAIGIFIARERKHPQPFFPADAWKFYKPLGAIFFAVILIRACFGGSRIYLPLLLQGVWGMGSLAAGFSITLASLAWSAGGFYVSGSKSVKNHLAKWGTGTLIAALLCILLALWSQSPVILVYVLWAVVGVGMGITTSVYNSAAMQVAEDYPSGAAGSALQLGATFGGAIGAAAANSLAQLGFGAGFDPKLLKSGALSGASLKSLVLGASFAEGLGALFAVLSLLAAWKFFRSRSSRDVDIKAAVA